MRTEPYPHSHTFLKNNGTSVCIHEISCKYLNEQKKIISQTNTLYLSNRFYKIEKNVIPKRRFIKTDISCKNEYAFYDFLLKKNQEKMCGNKR